MRSLALVLEYDGTEFAGFQSQRSRRTIQGEIEQAIEVIAGERIRVVAAGRTDAGVHASGQVISFTTESCLPAEIWVRALNARLPRSIAVREARDVPSGFHARFGALSRSYRYRIANGTSRGALCRQYRWHVPGRLDENQMAAAIRHLLGHHDFASFAGAGQQTRLGRTTRTIIAADCHRSGDEIDIDVEADGFLPHMVRNIVGTIVQVGRGKLMQSDIPEILAARDRARAGATAPPHGLCLVRIQYGESL
ncbi:MAG: tRNA pseudouridine(38-40) synthase TruA [Chloroflexota bacterium]|nr:MAG: tRNA pseudouridine(38-40) synthase TruA [Chloroflexota bacterium]